MNCIQGKILTEQGFKDGYILLKNTENPTIHFGTSSKSSGQKSLIIPPFVNAHTHIGDTFIRRKNISLPHNLEQLVAPPNGLKHTLLNKTDDHEKYLGIIHGLQELQEEGISTFIDFRENGINGIKLLKKSLDQIPLHSLILGRPQTNQCSQTEITNILQESDGIAISSLEDMNYNLINQIVEQTKKNNKKFALHVSERIREPIDQVLSLYPNFIVHMNKASEKDLQKVKDQKIPIVVCPRSNNFFGLKTNLKKMKKTGNKIFLGTDNFMFHPPSIIKEIQFIQANLPNLFSIDELFLMNTYQVRKDLNLKDNIRGSTLPKTWIILNPDNYQIKTILKKVEEG